MRRAVILPLALALLVLGTARAGAHTRSMSFSRWEFDEAGATVELRITLLELSRFDGGNPSPSYFADHLVLLEDGEPCAWLEPVRATHAPDGWAVYRWRILKEGPPGTSPRRTIHSRVMEGIAGEHAHFARIQAPGTPRTHMLERVLTADSPDWILDGTALANSGGSSVADYVRLGVEHILQGWDHLAFVLALMLMAASLRELAIIITSFTVAHSLTLGMAALGVLRPDAAAVEIHIGFSIALVAAENLWLAGGRDRWAPWLWTGVLLAAVGISFASRGALAPYAWAGLALFSLCHFKLLGIARHPGRLRALVSFAFGLVHGFGFAGVLMDMELPRERLLPALLGFNLGVEAGQLAVVALLWPALLLLGRMRAGAPRRFVAIAGSAALIAFGVFWMVTRNWA